MPREHRFEFPLPNGLHARPASELEAVASRFASDVTLVNLRGGTDANAKSVLSLVASDTRLGDGCVLRIAGADEDLAFTALTAFLRDTFPHCDEALPETAGSTAGRPLPRALKAAGVTRFYGGTPACRGLAMATVVRVGGLALAPGFSFAAAASSHVEQARFTAAVHALGCRLSDEVASAKAQQADVLKAHAALLRDVALADRVSALLATDGVTAGVAVLAAVGEFSAALQNAGSAYLRERVLDLQDVAGRLLVELYGESAVTRTPALVAPAVVVADALTPGQFLALDRRHLRGLVLAHAGATSHTVILARSFNIPTLLGVADALDLAAGEEVILDGARGLLIADLSENVRRYYALEATRLARQAAALGGYRDLPGATPDGRRLPFLANVTSASEVAAAVAAGAEGVGLFRTEMLFMDRDAAPSEEEQYAVYAEAARAAAGRPVVIRTIDIGGDKPVPYLDLPAEANPFLGYRGVRMYGEFAVLVRAQLRAILRASAHGSLKIMVPMIACPEEMRDFRALVDEVRAELLHAGLPHGADVPVGMMLEVPSAVFALPELARYADFFSLGTNDLTQYFLAADRDNARVRGLYAWTHPAFLRLLRQAVEGAHAAGRPIGLCGEMGENAAAQPLLLGLGLDSLSLGAPRILAAKAALARIDRARCQALAQSALACADRSEVTALLDNALTEGAALPLIAPDVIVLDSTAASKAEVIKEMADLLALAGRTGDGAAVEEAVWAREEAYSTGFGQGFAVPHCKSPHVVANTLALVRLRTPVAWGSLDGEPVRVAVLLAIREADHGKEHLRIFSKLSRLVMRDEFRDQLTNAPDVSTVLAVLNDQLSPASASA